MRAVVTSAWREVVRRMVGLREKGLKAVAMVAVRARAAATFIVVGLLGVTRKRGLK